MILLKLCCLQIFCIRVLTIDILLLLERRLVALVKREEGGSNVRNSKVDAHRMLLLGSGLLVSSRGNLCHVLCFVEF